MTVTFVPKEEKTNTDMERLLLELDLSLPASKVKLNALSLSGCQKPSIFVTRLLAISNL